MQRVKYAETEVRAQDLCEKIEVDVLGSPSLINLRLFFALSRERIFIETHSIQSRRYTSEKIYCLQAPLCIFRPGHFTGWGSEGVKTTQDTHLRSFHYRLIIIQHCLYGAFYF